MQLQRLLEIRACLFEIIASKIESAQVVIRFRIIRLGSHHLLKRLRCLVQVTVLEQGNTIGKVIALERTLVDGSAKGKRPLLTLSSRGRRGPHIFQQSLSVDRALVHLDDHALFVHQKGGGNRQIPPPVK